VSAETRTRARHVGTKSAEAYRLYARGSNYWGQRTDLSLRTAVQFFGQALEKDPDYALAYAGIANSYSLLGAYKTNHPRESFPKAKEAALKAVALDESSAEAHTSLALVNWLWDWDWAAADGEFRRAIELDPAYVTAHHWYGLYLAEMGRFDEAVASERRALALNPLSLYVTADLSRVYFYARRYEEALKQYRKGLEMDPTFGSFYAELIPLYEQLGMTDGLLEVGEKMFAVTPRMRTALREGDTRGYWRERLANHLDKHTDVNAYFMADAYARLGEAG
jgi:tetratricopeptide (TPR) repeat protein